VTSNCATDSLNIHGLVYLDLDASLEDVYALLKFYLFTFCESLFVTGKDVVYGQTSTRVNREILRRDQVTRDRVAS
jgi:hypothetical protein